MGDSGFSERNLLFIVEALEERLRVHQGKHFLIHSTDFLSNYYVSGSVLCSDDIPVNKTVNKQKG